MATILFNSLVLPCWMTCILSLFNSCLVHAQNPFSPATLPLAVRSPYLSAWESSLTTDQAPLNQWPVTWPASVSLLFGNPAKVAYSSVFALATSFGVVWCCQSGRCCLPLAGQRQSTECLSYCGEHNGCQCHTHPYDFHYSLRSDGPQCYVSQSNRSES